MSDEDGDGVGVGGSATLCIGDLPPAGYALATAEPDCDDGDPAHWYDCGLCEDGDGDNYGTNCDLGSDCDDSDELIHPGGDDFPDDGIDGDCQGGDYMASEEGGIFVSNGGDDANPGTMDEPMASLGAAMVVALSEGKEVYLAARSLGLEF